MAETDVVIAYVLFTGLIGLIGAYLCYVGFRRNAYITDLLRADLSSVGSLAPGDAAVKLDGVVKPHPAYAPFRAPFSEDWCVYERWTVSRKNLVTLSYLAGGQLESGDRSRPFVLDVDGESIPVDLPNIESVLLGEGEEPEEDVEMSEAVREVVGEDGELTSETKRQTILTVGEDVTVFGRVREEDGELLITGFDDGERTGVVTNQDGETLLLRKAGAFGRMLVGGAIVAGTVLTYVGMLLGSGSVFAALGTLLFFGGLGVGIVWHVAFVIYLEVKEAIATRTDD